MRNLLLLSLVVASFSAYSHELLDSWTDGNENTWNLLDVKKSYERAKLGCEQNKAFLPTFDELSEALDYGLADVEKNAKFGARSRS